MLKYFIALFTADIVLVHAHVFKYIAMLFALAFINSTIILLLIYTECNYLLSIYIASSLDLS